MISPPSEPKAVALDDVLDEVRRRCNPLPVERVPLEDAQGRVLREDIVAPEDQPAFDRSAMDGYAIRLDDHSHEFRVVDAIRAGDWKPRALAPGEAVRIATGGALPGEGLRVVMKEDVRVADERIVIERPQTSRNIRFRGEDAGAGQILLEAGTRMGPGAIALLASLGHTRPTVTRPPRAVHLATGNELVAPGQNPGAGQIRDSNSSLVRAFLEARGVEVRQLRAPEDQEAAAQLLQPALGQPVDLLLVSGGASVGPHDFTRALLEELGYTILVAKTNTRPGKPLILAEGRGGVAFGLPGNPLAHFVCLNIHVQTALDRLLGVRPRPVFLSGRLGADLPGDSNPRETLWPAEARPTSAGVEVTPLPWRSSGDLTSLARANALLRVPPMTGSVPAGSAAEFAFTGPLP